MGLFDLFSSSNEQDAYQAQRQGYKQGQAGAEKFIGKGADELKKYFGQGIDLYGQLGAYKPDNKYIGQLAGRGSGYLDSYENALGLNGQKAADKAFGQYQAGPEFNWQVDQASQAVNRNAASSGLLGSGNTALAVSDTARKMASADYGGYLDRLGQLGQMGYGGIGQAAGLTNQNNQFGAQYDLSKTQGQAGLYGQLGSGLASGYNQLGTNAYNSGVGIGQAQAGYLNSFDQTGANILGTGLGIAGAVAGFPNIGGAVGASGVGGGIAAKPYMYGGPR